MNDFDSYVIFINMTCHGGYRIDLCGCTDNCWNFTRIRRAYRKTHFDIWALADFYKRKWSVKPVDINDRTRDPNLKHIRHESA